MFDKLKIREKVNNIFDLAEKAGTVLLSSPTYLGEVRFELLFFFFFWLDYREYFHLGNEIREKIIDEFLERVSKEFENKDSLKRITILHQQRINKYFQLSRSNKTIGEFLENTSKYIAALAYFFQKEQYPFDKNIENIFNEISKESVDSLSKAIAKSIFLHGFYLFY